jgi:uncharacterized protein DUF3352
LLPAPNRSLRTVAQQARLLAAAALIAGAAALASGCGAAHSSGTSADPARAVPGSAALFAEATVRPSGAQQSAALAAGKALTGQANPYLRLVAALQTPGSPVLSYKRDLAPWLGPRAGIFLSSIGSSSQLLSLLQLGLSASTSGTGAFPFLTGPGGAQGAIVLDTSDAAKARSFLEAQARHAGAHRTSYRGVSYQESSSGVAFGLVNRFAVIGRESAMHGVIDTALGAPSLAAQGGYSKLMAAAPSGVLAHLYANGATAGAAQGPSGLLGLLAGPHEASISLLPGAGSITVDADTPASGGGGALLSSGSEGAQALSELPGESWLAVGLPHLGTSLDEDVRGLRALTSLGGSGPEAPAASAGINVKGLLEGLLTPLSMLGAPSAQARHDYASWMGPAGIFASGAGLLELRAAVVIASKDPVRSRSAVAKLAAQLRQAGDSVGPVSIAGTDAAVGARISGLPVELDIAAGRASGGQAKFVLGLGAASVTSALNPPSTLAGSASYTAAGSALGEGIKPSLMVDFPTLLSLLEGVGLSEDPTISKFVPYLRNLTTLAGGGHGASAGIERFRLVLGLRQGG